MLPSFLGAGGVDLETQYQWLTGFSRELWSGEFYPRILPELNVGRGSPVFFYYPPLTYFLGAIFYPLNSLASFGFAQIAATGWLGLFLSGLSCYYWLKTETSEQNALMGSLFYMLSPFHLAHNFYYTLLMGQFFSYIFFPLLMLAAKRSYLMFSLCLALLALTNIPSTIIFAPLTVVYALLVNRSYKIIPAILLSLGLAAIYLLPAYFYRDASNIAFHWSKEFSGHDYSERFLDFSNLFYSSFVLLLFALVIIGYRQSEKTLMSKFWLTASLFAFFMNLAISKLLWETVPLLSIIQIPGRFLMIPTVASALFFTRYNKMILLGFFIITVTLCYISRTSIDEFKSNEARYFRFINNVEQYPNYLPSNEVVKILYADQNLRKFISEKPAVEIKESLARKITFIPHKAGQTVIPRFIFPGMAVNNLEIERNPETWEVSLSIPPELVGKELTIETKPLWPEVLGTMISAFSLAIWLGLRIIYRKKY